MRSRNLVALALVVLSLTPASLATLSRPARERAVRAVVALAPLQELPAGSFAFSGYTFNGRSYMRGTTGGSGSVINPAGIVLTNAHVVTHAGDRGPAALVEVRMTERADQAPRPAYLARVTRYDTAQDLASLQIVADVRGEPTGLLNLVALEVGSSDDLMLGDEIAIFGYPAIGGQTITYTSGRIGGFVGEDYRGDGRTFIKTDAKISSGTSGGAALDDEGRLVGIATAMAFDRRTGAQQESVNYLRPASLALEMMRRPVAAPVAAQPPKP